MVTMVGNKKRLAHDISQAIPGEKIADKHGDRYAVYLDTVNESGNEDVYRVKVRAASTFRAINRAIEEFDDPRGRRVTGIVWVARREDGEKVDAGIEPLKITITADP